MNTIPRVLSERVIRGSAITSVLLVIAGSAIIAIAAQIAINVPFSPVPLTMQPVAVLLVGVVLGSRRGAAAALLYLIEGASGAPVFAQAHGGVLWLAGATAGYLWSYPFAAFVAGWFSERNWSSTSSCHSEPRRRRGIQSGDALIAPTDPDSSRSSALGMTRTTMRCLIGMLIALAVIYAGGWSWLALLTGPRPAFTMGVAPFVVADIVKIAITAALLPQLQRIVVRS